MKGFTIKATDFIDVKRHTCMVQVHYCHRAGCANCTFEKVVTETRESELRCPLFAATKKAK